MKRYIYALVALALLGVEGLSAQMKTSYFMEGSYFRTEMNPALVPTRGYVAVPFIPATKSLVMPMTVPWFSPVVRSCPVCRECLSVWNLP